jgi:pSer/pThr/pTyr-binding forkhead associated (FHA) protein
MRTWTIGSGADCDVVVAQPRVSGRHCRFTELADGYLIEDLGSSNGTYVNGERIEKPTRVSTADAITLGALVPMPWPPGSGAPGATLVRIGRTADNDIVLDDPRVSSYHARLIVSEGRTQIEDAGSSNGTTVNSSDNPARKAIDLTEADTVYFGSMAVPARRLLSWRRRTAPVEVVADPPPLPKPPRTSDSPEPAPEPAAAALTVSPWTILLLAQAPVLATAIILACGRQSTAPVTATTWPSVADGIASTAFALALSALWMGGSLAAWSSLIGRSPTGREASPEARLLGSSGSWLITLAFGCVAQCGVVLAVVYWGGGLRGPWPSMLGVLSLASAVGLALGLLVFSLIRSPIAASAVLMVVFVAMVALGGRIWRLPASSPAARIAEATPSRWAFEGLLLLENEGREWPAQSEEEGAARTDDPAEGFFPAESERMGTQADAMALGSMFIGLAGAAAFMASGSKLRR